MNWGVRDGLAGLIYGGLVVVGGVLLKAMDSDVTDYAGGIALLVGAGWVVFALIDIAKGLQEGPRETTPSEDD